MSAEKCAVRQRLREWRKGLSPSTVAAAGVAVWQRVQHFHPYRDARSVIGYFADENEIPTDTLLRDAVRSGRVLYLPRTAGGAGLACWQPGEPLIAGLGGVLEPCCRQASASLLQAPVIAFLPVVAWNPNGTRLGRGGGFYDRLFAALPCQVTRVGLAYELQERSGLPRDAWDVSVHYIITERRLIRCREGVEPLQKGGVQFS